MVLLGGVRHAYGGVVGAAIVVFLPEFLSFASKVAFLPESVRAIFSEYSYHLIIYGILLFLIAAFAPGGLVKLFLSTTALIGRSSGRFFDKKTPLMGSGKRTD